MNKALCKNLRMDEIAWLEDRKRRDTKETEEDIARFNEYFRDIQNRIATSDGRMIFLNSETAENLQKTLDYMSNVIPFEAHWSLLWKQGRDMLYSLIFEKDDMISKVFGPDMINKFQAAWYATDGLNPNDILGGPEIEKVLGALLRFLEMYWGVTGRKKLPSPENVATTSTYRVTTDDELNLEFWRYFFKQPPLLQKVKEKPRKNDEVIRFNAKKYRKKELNDALAVKGISQDVIAQVIPIIIEWINSDNHDLFVRENTVQLVLTAIMKKIENTLGRFDPRSYARIRSAIQSVFYSEEVEKRQRVKSRIIEQHCNQTYVYAHWKEHNCRK